MTGNSTIDIVGQRLRNQKLVQSDLREPVEIVSWLGAVQSQDYAGAKWALNLRGRGSADFTDSDVDRAFNEGGILRTHVLRPTWHFVTPADIRWILSLTGPRVQVGNRHYCRKNGLDEEILARSRKTLERALSGGKHLTRTALGAALARAGIAGSGQRLAYLMMDAELEQVICSGPRLGKQFTYALLDERAPRARMLKGDEALAELTKRYFASHGPATVRDFVWWSGLTVKSARTGLEILGDAVASDPEDGLTYWSVPSGRSTKTSARSADPTVYLLPNYDEYLIAHKDRGHCLDPSGLPPTGAFDGFPHQLVIAGMLRGAWRRTPTARKTTITVRPFRPLSKTEKHGLAAAVERYGAFMNLPVDFSLV